MGKGMVECQATSPRPGKEFGMKEKPFRCKKGRKGGRGLGGREETVDISPSSECRKNKNRTT